ncbi:universal stress protein [Rhizobium sp. 18065]|uniref:universal stress protein n=1 Tax=Rhizobium sp. 18065 TaxID=2681411 RepID=UPI00135AABB5|nr:universal stress protein [Rhizobium sp. 18065]
MSYRTVISILSVHQPEEDLRSAIAFARKEGAHLVAILVSMFVPPAVEAYAGAISTVWLEERDKDRLQLLEAEKKAREYLAATGISFELELLQTEIALADNQIGTRARYADIVLIGRNLNLDPELRARAIDGALFSAPKPILVVPEKKEPTLSPRNIVLAWDSSVEASRGVREALEMMKAAEEVVVTMVDPTASYGLNGGEPGADIATFLARHGVKVSVERIASGGRSVADVLNEKAIAIDADLIVMGAYGHSRLRERIFGGVTRDMLEGAVVPVLLAR